MSGKQVVYIMCSVDEQLYATEIHTMEREMFDFLGFPCGTGYFLMYADMRKRPDFAQHIDARLYVRRLIVL